METPPLPLNAHFPGQCSPTGNGLSTGRLTRTDAFPYPNSRPKNASKVVCSVYVARMLIVVIAQCEEFSVRRCAKSGLADSGRCGSRNLDRAGAERGSVFCWRTAQLVSAIFDRDDSSS